MVIEPTCELAVTQESVWCCPWSMPFHAMHIWQMWGVAMDLQSIGSAGCAADIMSAGAYLGVYDIMALRLWMAQGQ